MPAARHISRSPCIALAVIATMRGRSSGCQRAQIWRDGFEAVHLRHLHVHQHDVVGSVAAPIRRPRCRSTRGRRDSPSAAGAAARASGSRRCPRRAGCAADGAPPCSGSSCVPGAATGAACGADVVREQRLPACRTAATGAPAWPRYAANRPSSAPTSRRPSELNSTSGRVGAALADRACERHAVHLRHVHVQDREVERLAARRASAAPRAATPVARDAIPHFAVCRSSTRRLVALSSTTSTRLPCERGLHADEFAAPRGGQFADRGHDGERGTSIPGRARRSAPTSVPPISSARRLLIASPRPVPPYLRVVDESACENDWKSRLIASADRPMPVSRTANVTSDFALRDRLRASTVSTTSPSSVNLTALESRLSRICRRRVTSPTIASGTSPSNT